MLYPLSFWAEAYLISGLASSAPERPVPGEAERGGPAFGLFCQAFGMIAPFQVVGGSVPVASGGCRA